MKPRNLIYVVLAFYLGGCTAVGEFAKAYNEAQIEYGTQPQPTYPVYTAPQLNTMPNFQPEQKRMTNCYLASGIWMCR